MLISYVKVALRNIRRHASYTIINVLGLGVSVACAVIIFTLTKGHLSYDNFHADRDRIYRMVTEQHRDQVSYAEAVPAPLGRAFRDDYTYAEKTARVCTTDILISVENGTRKFKEPDVSFAEVEFFDIFNFPLKEGSIATALHEPNTAILTEKMAKKYFGEEDPINKTFRFDNKIDFRITGVLEDIPENTDLKSEIYLSYATMKQYNEWLASDDSWSGISGEMRTYTRLRPGVAVAEVEAVFPAYVKKHRSNSKNVHYYKLQPLSDIHFNARYGGPMEKRNLWILMFIGVLLLATACVNFINLATAQATSRAKEVGVRKVLGGMRAQLFRQFMTETCVITILAVVAGLLIAYTGMPYVNALFGSDIRIDLASDLSLTLFLPVLVIVVTLLAGVYPGLILSGFQPIQSLKGRLVDLKIGGLNVRRSLIVSQLAIAELLMIGLVVIVYQVRYAREADMGFDKEAVLVVPVVSSDNKMTTLRTELLTIPGVEKISLCFSPPASNDGWNTNLKVNNRSEDEAFLVSCKMADDHYLSTFGLKLVAGRNITPSDTVREFIVNETFAKKMDLTPEDLIGTTIGVNSNAMRGPVVGVVKDFHDKSFHDDINPIFISTKNDMYNTYALKVKAAGINNTIEAVRKKWSAMYPDLIFEYKFVDEQIAGFYKTEDMMMKIIQAFCLVAILIGCMGLYGLVSYMANQKTKEIGIRKVLGGSVPQILWIFGKEFSLLIVLSFAIAAPAGGIVMGKWLEDFKYKIEMGPWIFMTAIAATTIICLCTVFIQSLRAATQNPVLSLRSE